MEEGKREVANALELISRQGLTTMIMIAMILMIFVSIVLMIIVNREELIAVGEEKGDKNRRAAVFYFDKVGFSRNAAEPFFIKKTLFLRNIHRELLDFHSYVGGWRHGDFQGSIRQNKPSTSL